MQLARLNCNTHHRQYSFCLGGKSTGPAMPTTMETVGDLRSALSPRARCLRRCDAAAAPGELTRAFIGRAAHARASGARTVLRFALVAAITVNNTIRGMDGATPFEVESSAMFARPDAKTQDAKAVMATTLANRRALHEAGRCARQSPALDWLRERVKARAKI